MATVKRKVIGTATVKQGGTAISLGITGVTPRVPVSIETDKAAAFGDSVETQVPRRLASLGDLSFELIYEGAAPSLVIGSVAAWTIAVTYTDGGATPVTDTVTETCSIKSLEPAGTVSVDGDRKAALTLTLAPVGGTDRTDVATEPAPGASSSN